MVAALNAPPRNRWASAPPGIEAEHLLQGLTDLSLFEGRQREPGVLGSQSTATREILEKSLLEQLQPTFPLNSGARFVSPVIFPPGLARLATKPCATGSFYSRHDNGDRFGCIL